MADHDEVGRLRGAAPLHRQLQRHAVAARRIGDHGDHRFGDLDQIDRAGVAAREFGVEPRGVGDVADQPVEAAHIVLHDREQTIARGPDLTRGRVSTALRSEVSGFFSSWATSAAKLSIASMRL